MTWGSDGRAVDQWQATFPGTTVCRLPIRRLHQLKAWSHEQEIKILLGSLGTGGPARVRALGGAPASAPTANGNSASRPSGATRIADTYGRTY